MRRTQVAIINQLYEKALSKDPELAKQIESQIDDFRNYQASSKIRQSDKNFDSIVYNPDEEFEYLSTELLKYVGSEVGKDIDRDHGTDYFSRGSM